MRAIGTDIVQRCARMRVGAGHQTACKLKASWRIGLGLRAHKDDRERLYMIDAALCCNRCRASITMKNFVDGRIFAYVSRQAIANDWPPPRRSLSRLVFEHLRQGYVT